MQRDRDLRNLDTKAGQVCGGRTHLGVNVGLGIGLLEPLGDDADPPALNATFEHTGIGVRLHVVLPRIVAVRPGDNLQQ